MNGKVEWWQLNKGVHKKRHVSMLNGGRKELNRML